MHSEQQRVVLVRHSERCDFADNQWAETAERPHDPTITERGKEMARFLGNYFVKQQGINPSDVVVLTSPLTRCVETAHWMAVGMNQMVASEIMIPIYIEPALAEGGYWLEVDLRRNPKFLTGFPTPLFFDAAFHMKQTSPFVQPTPANGNRPFYDVKMVETKEWKLKEQEKSLNVRCAIAAKRLGQHSLLNTKVVICVGHVDSVNAFYFELTGMKPEGRPAFTGWVDVARKPLEEKFAPLCVEDSCTWTDRHIPLEWKESCKGEREK